MDELRVFCRRVLGPGPLADEAADHAHALAATDRIDSLAAAARACRERADQAPHAPQANGAEASDLSTAVALEVAAATAKLPERQREALALQELLHLSHQQIARVLELEPAAVAALLSRARLRLRAERRGISSDPLPNCAVHDRSLRCLACRHDSEPLSGEDDDWLMEHLGQCEECARAHAAMLEASVCYRAWR